MPEIFDITTVVNDDLYLDPNNPRLGREAPGYSNPKLLFDDEIQGFDFFIDWSKEPSL